MQKKKDKNATKKKKLIWAPATLNLSVTGAHLTEVGFNNDT